MSILICLDPGHGGTDRGSIGFSSIEKDICLDIAYRVERKLKRYEGMKVILTRSFDLNRTAEERSEWANRSKADLLISLHSNAATDSTLSGFTSYVSVLAGARTRRIQCWLHNQITYFLRQRGVQDLGKKNDTESMTGSLHVLQLSRMPAIALGSLFMTNPQDHRLLSDNNFLDQYSSCIASGLASIFRCPEKQTTASEVYDYFL
ncbi:N-acetylmuramoyl-L-alanine amidase [Seinonella peptonophila]|uniref:N-acetylmuramoyl-L-alanine amidase n=1 Tax=Seinonella peptonophila TaxID=112248 RepID=A0A1M5AH67_9BACL|nr:N-acetylmuramoyl-L-alanine amidase [Seinonella peptonophila]SHF29629.1 N-acetylmuramoyl-L-alanine amidase [Seinonella peptonophila]